MRRAEALPPAAVCVRGQLRFVDTGLPHLASHVLQPARTLRHLPLDVFFAGEHSTEAQLFVQHWPRCAGSLTFSSIDWSASAVWPALLEAQMRATSHVHARRVLVKHPAGFGDDHKCTSSLNASHPEPNHCRRSRSFALQAFQLRACSALIASHEAKTSTLYADILALRFDVILGRPLDWHVLRAQALFKPRTVFTVGDFVFYGSRATMMGLTAMYDRLCVVERVSPDKAPASYSHRSSLHPPDMFGMIRRAAASVEPMCAVRTAQDTANCTARVPSCLLRQRQYPRSSVCYAVVCMGFGFLDARTTILTMTATGAAAKQLEGVAGHASNWRVVTDGPAVVRRVASSLGWVQNGSCECETEGRCNRGYFYPQGLATLANKTVSVSGDMADTWRRRAHLSGG